MGLSLIELLPPRPLTAPPTCHPDWPLALLAQPQLLRTLTVCQKAEPSQHLFTLKGFYLKNAPDCYCLRCNWAGKNIKARIAWHVMKWERQRAERKTRLKQHLEGKTRRRRRRGNKTTVLKDITAIPWNMWRQRVLTPGLQLLRQSGSNDRHYQTLSQPIISWPLLVGMAQHVTNGTTYCLLTWM